MPEFSEERRIIRRRDASTSHVDDHVVREEPLEIKVEYSQDEQRKRYTLAITMRTPGNDEDLVSGFLFTEGIVDRVSQVARFERPPLHADNTIVAHLDPEVNFDPGQQQRHFYTSSSCGVCGKASIDMVHQVAAYRLRPDFPVLEEAVLMGMAQSMRSDQLAFTQTGGIHAATLFSSDGTMLCTREDVGRHNAVDKLIGWAGRGSRIPLSAGVMVVSGRAGFELIQKAVVAGVSIFAAVGAPSSLALQLADESDLTVVGFLRDNGFNVYTHGQRIKLQD